MDCLKALQTKHFDIMQLNITLKAQLDAGKFR